jgi:hypothetical protein
MTLILDVGLEFLNCHLKELIGLFFLTGDTVRAGEGVLCFFESVLPSKPSGT